VCETLGQTKIEWLDQALVYADGVNLLGQNMYIIRNVTENVLQANRNLCRGKSR